MYLSQTPDWSTLWYVQCMSVCLFVRQLQGGNCKTYHRQLIKISNLNFMREREMFYLTMHSTHFIYGYMASDIWLRTILIVRKETCCRHIGLTARVLLYAPSHRQDNTYHSLCYTSRGALAGTRNSSMGPPHEGLIRRPIAPWANALPLSYVPIQILWRRRVLKMRWGVVKHSFIHSFILKMHPDILKMYHVWLYLSR